MPESGLLIDATIKRIEIIIRCTGINIKIGEKTKMDKYRSWFIYYLNLWWLGTDTIGAMLAFFVGLIRRDMDFTDLTYCAPCFTMCWLSISKGFLIVKNEDKVDLLIETMRKLEIKQKDLTQDKDTEKIIQKEDNFLNRVLRVLSIFNVILLISFALNPLFLMLLKYLNTGHLKLLLPFIILYPFDPFDMKYYPVVYLKQIWSEIIVVYNVCVVDFMFFIFCTYLRTQFLLLQYNIEKIIPLEITNGTRYDKEKVKSRLVELVKWHQDLISTAALLEELFTKSTLINFMLSSVIICLTGFDVVAIDDIVFVMIFVSFLVTSLSQVFFLCFFGDLLRQSSMGVSDAVYNSKWYIADASLGKSLLLIQTRATTPCKLTAFNFADVNLKAFMRICSTAWSYFALLQTLYTGPGQ